MCRISLQTDFDLLIRRKFVNKFPMSHYTRFVEDPCVVSLIGHQQDTIQQTVLSRSDCWRRHVFNVQHRAVMHVWHGLVTACTLTLPDCPI